MIPSEREAEHGGCNEQSDRAASAELEQPEQRDRKDQKELLLDCQAPGMDERLELRWPVEISALRPEENVRNEAADREQALGELLEIVRAQPIDGERNAGQRDQEQAAAKCAGRAARKTPLKPNPPFSCSSRMIEVIR